MPNGTVVTCECADRELAFMFDLMDAGLEQWEASRIAYGQLPPTVGAPPAANKAWCRATVRDLFAQLRALVGLPASEGSPAS